MWLDFVFYLEPVKDILLAHVSEHALVYEGTVASDITLKYYVNTPLKILKQKVAQYIHIQLDLK